MTRVRSSTLGEPSHTAKEVRTAGAAPRSGAPGRSRTAAPPSRPRAALPRDPRRRDGTWQLDRLGYDAQVALDPIKQWTLVCSGLVAHADGVLDGSECERLMNVLEGSDDLDGEEYGAWMAAISDATRLEELLAVLQPPPAESHRELLEGAWVMAVVDGQRTPEESAMLERLAATMGVEPLQLEYWREAWSSAEQEFARGVACVLAWVMGNGAPAPSNVRAAVADALWATPCEQALRDELVGRAMAPCTRDEAAAAVAGMSRARRIAALQRSVVAISRLPRSDEHRRRLVDLAWAASVPAEHVDRWFH